MPTIVSRKQPQQVKPGVYDGGLYAVRDLGKIRTVYGTKDVVELEFLIDQLDEHGEPMRIRQRFTKSLHRKSKLCSVVAVLLGGKPVPFDVVLEDLVGAYCRLVISQRTDQDGLTWSNIAQVLRPVATQTAPVSAAAPMVP